ncbi:MAG: excinuclease ABC subunit C [Actinobacteria bacterium RBG_16_64_13]|nr:MAG: excinuclease ABC subunit C [Actinobacteria bacterium RBG_16_64_13]
MSGSDDLEHQIRHAPDLPGVYLYRDGSGEVLYVGKALSLRKRLASYLPAIEGGENGRLPAKVNEMVGRSASVEWIVTSNEVEALLLEHNLIKQHRSPFNIRLRDDKSYPYIMITVQDEFPRVMFTRQPHRRGNLYFGPFSSAAKVRETLDALGKVFPVRACRGHRPGRHSGSPCLQFHIARCPGPCLETVSVAEYQGVIEQVVDFLSGRETKVAARLERSMQDAAGRQDFESAAVFRDRLEALRHVLERQQIESSSLGSADVAGLAVDDWGANVQVFITRDGKLADRRSLTFVNVAGADAQEVFERFVAEYYGMAPAVPSELIVPPSVRETGRLASFLEGLRGTKVDVRQAERGDKRRLQEMADRNAALALAHERLREERTRERRLGALTALEATLGLEGPPMRIEGFDISNLGAENIVASMVVFEGGVPKKSDYRKFAIRSTEGQDDVGAIFETVVRRFTHDAAGGERAAEGAEAGASGLRSRPYDPSFEAVPDLVLIDGGKGQLGAAVAALGAAGLEAAVTVISLAKREEEVFVPWSREALDLAVDDPGLLLLQRVRDEAHRFALGFHRRKRAAGTTHSLLDQLPGIGDKRKRAIMQHFGSPERFLQASREELEAVPGLPGKVAREVHAYVHKTG